MPDLTITTKSLTIKVVPNLPPPPQRLNKEK